MADSINNDDILRSDLGISTAPPDSPAGNPEPANHDHLIYQPSDPEGQDVTNQHFQVISLGKDRFFATWTRSCLEGGDNQHIVASISHNAGASWSKPRTIDGPELDRRIASWSFPVYAKKFERIYVFYNKNCDFVDFHHQWTGQLWFRFSEDGGNSWSDPMDYLKIEKNDYSNPSVDVDPNWIVFQPPIHTHDGKVLTGFTHIATKALSDGTNFPSESRFLRFDNILSEPDPERLILTTLPSSGKPGLRFPNPQKPDQSMAQEPAIAELPNGNLFCVMRTLHGYIAYSVSGDGGETWSDPDFLRYSESGERIPNPVVPCPIYRLSDDRYLLIFYNNTGDANGGRSPIDWCRNRRPAWFTIGRFVDARQPLEFGHPNVLADNDRIPISRKQLTEIATYPSVVEEGGNVHLFFPDRKHFLLSKELSEDFLRQSLPL